MSFSSIAIEQREKEVKALKWFLIFSTITSLALHIAVLASGVGNLLARVPQLEEEPIELTLVEPEVKEIPIIEEKLALGNNTREVLRSSGGSGGNAGDGSVASKVSQTPTIPAPPQASIGITPVEKPVIPPVQKFVDNFKPQPVKEDPVVSKEPTQESSENLRNALSRIQDTITSGASTGNTESSSSGSNQPTGNTSVAFGTGNGNGLGTGTGNGNGTGNGVGFGIGNGNGTGNGTGTSEAPRQPNLPTEVKRSGNPNGSLDGRAACSNCKVKYSESARRRGSEGRVEVAVNTDKDGNVTSVRVVNSSGDRDLDEEHIRQAREWKLKPSEGGRQGVKIATEYSIEGSRRNRQVRERQQQRQEQERQRQVATSSSDNNSSEQPRRRRSLEASINNTDVLTTSRRRINFEASQQAASSNSQESRSSRLSRRLRSRNVENNSGEEAPRKRREVTADVRTSGTQPGSTRRQRRNLNQSNQSLDNGSRLRNALRRSRESAPTVVPSSGGNDGE
jgi:TonB family protein